MKTFLIVGFVILFVLTVLFVWYYFFGETGEIKKAKKEFEIFGLKEGFVPQGITYLKQFKKFLISGYVSKKNEASRIYVVNAETYEFEKYVTLKFLTGRLYDGHAGGITNYGDSCWVSSEGRAYRFVTHDVINAKNGDSVRVIDSFQTYNNADFCFVFDGYLWIGEFYRLTKFKTDIAHHTINDDGEQSHALAFGFKLSKCVTCGTEGEIPERALTLPDSTQGVAVSNQTIFVSTSYGITPSKVYEYENVLLKKSQKSLIVNEKNVSLWELSSKNLRKTRILPEMAEEVEFVDGKLFVLFESASNKYKLVTRTRINHVFSIK